MAKFIHPIVEVEALAKVIYEAWSRKLELSAAATIAARPCVFEDERHDVHRCNTHGGFIDSDSYSELHGHSWGDEWECKHDKGQPCLAVCSNAMKAAINRRWGDASEVQAERAYVQAEAVLKWLAEYMPPEMRMN